MNQLSGTDERELHKTNFFRPNGVSGGWKRSSASRALTPEDQTELQLELGGPWSCSDLGDEGAREWKEARIRDMSAWVLPATLLMTVSFALVHALDADSISATPHGYPYEVPFRRCVSYVYIFATATSGMLALKSINDHTQSILLFINTPAPLCPQLHHFARHEFDLRQEPEKEWWRPPDWKIWLSSFMHSRLFPKLVHGSETFYVAVDFLCVGLLCGTFLKYGIMYSIFIAVPMFIIDIDLRVQSSQRFTGPWKKYERKFLDENEC